MLAVHNPNLLPYSVFGKNMTWMHPAGRLIWACVILLIGLGVIMVIMRRPKSPEPATWAQSMVGALGVFSLMLIAYGTIPHEWIVFANAYLHWSAAAFVFQKNRFIHFDVNKQAANDAVAAIIYVVMLTGNIVLFAMWQKRPVAQPAPDDASAEAPGDARQPAGTSAYNRPVTAKV
jgi:preprotein translocase subunit SecY